jgi:hypothetical protein
MIAGTYNPDFHVICIWHAASHMKLIELESVPLEGNVMQLTITAVCEMNV